MISGPEGNIYYNLEQNVFPTYKKNTRTFDDFALGLMLAEIGTGVPPYFNPDGTTILAHKETCRMKKVFSTSCSPKEFVKREMVESKSQRTTLQMGRFLSKRQ